MALVRAYIVFKVCGIQWVVKNSEFLLKTSLRIFGSKIVSFLLRPTLFGHFCGGEDLVTIKPTVDRLKRSNIGGILDFAAEADVEAEEPLSSSSVDTPTTILEGNALARQYSYQTERQCDANKKIFETAIKAVHGVTPGGFAAIKVTALGNPLFLERWSESLREMHRLFSLMDKDQDGNVTLEEFKSAWGMLFMECDQKFVEQQFELFDRDNTGRIDPVAWATTLDPQTMRKLASFCREEGPFSAAVLNEEEERLLDSMRMRLSDLVVLADSLDVRLMIDAEHTYFQPAIDNLVLGVQREYNLSTDRVYQTIQCYLKDARERNQMFMQQAEDEGWVYAVKLVRGAYMYQERARAAARNEPSPIHDTIEDTHRCYEEVMKDVIFRSRVQKKLEKPNLVVATHNQRSVECAIDLIDRAGFKPEESGVSFGQLLGMADHLTYTLGAHRYNAYKYIPYGPILECLPYLIRRAQENSDLMGSVGYEMKMLVSEITRRLFYDRR